MTPHTKTIIFFLLVFGFNSSFAQSGAERFVNQSNQPGANYYSIVQQAEAYYSAHPNDTSEYSGMLQFARWQEYWQNRVMMKDSIPGSFKYRDLKYAQLMQNPIACTNLAGANWTCIGPMSPSVSGASGRMDCIAEYDPNSNIVFAGSQHAGLFRTSNFNSTTPQWYNVTDYLNLPGLGVTDIVVDPAINQSGNHTIWICTFEERFAFTQYGIGVLRSTDGGQTWVQTGLSFLASLNRQTFKIVLDLTSPVSSRVLYAAVNESTHDPDNHAAVYKSTDDGMNWSRLQGLTDNLVLTANAIACEQRERQITDIALLPNSSNTVFASTNSSHVTTCPESARLYRSTNAGSSWTDITNILPGINPPTVYFEKISVETTPANPLVVYVYATCNGFAGTCSFNHYIYKSIDGGSTFSLVQIHTNLEADKLLVSPTDPNVIYFYEGRFFYVSYNGGVNYNACSNAPGIYHHDDVRCVFVRTGTSSGANDRVYITTDGGVNEVKFINSSSSYVAGSSTDKNGLGLNISQGYGLDVDERDPERVVYGAQDNHLMYLEYGVWSRRGATGDGHEVVFNDACPTNGYYGLANTILTSLPLRYSSTSFMSNASINPPATYSMLTRPMYHNAETGELYIGYSDLYKKTANCITASGSWTTLTNFGVPPYNLPTGRKVVSFDINETNKNCWVVAFYGATYSQQSNKLFRTTDNGSTFTDITNGISVVPYLSITDVVTDPLNPARIWVTMSGFALSAGSARVYYSGNGGSTWSDISSGLPEFPVNCIVYEKGTNDGLYVGTDVGVYYHNASMIYPYWTCFSTNLPATPNILDLEINYCGKTITCTSFGRSAWRSPLASTSVSTAQTITTNTNWSGILVVNSDIVVPNGVTLTISGVNTVVGMSENKKIIVQRGGKLIVDGAKITNNCGKKWFGIEVWGDNTISQYATSPVAQGYAEFKNGAVLEYMQQGVITDRTGYSGYHGGIIKAYNTTFRNNIKSIQILSYANFLIPSNTSAPNLCYFQTCTFETTPAWPATFGNPLPMVSTDNTSGIFFKGCTFRNTTPIAQMSSQVRGTAISSLDASYNVGAYCVDVNCNTLTRGRFEGLTYGINASAANPLKTCSIDRVDFYNNLKGALLTGLNYATVDLSTFTADGDPFGYGLYLDACSGYQVEQNSFSSLVLASGFGLFVKNSNSISNLNGYGNSNNIYNNSFDGFGFACTAYDDNDGPATYDGLRFNCNDYSNNKNDINVAHSGLPAITTDIGLYQGTATSATTYVRNRYITNNCVPNQENQFGSSKSSGQQIIYHTNNASQLIPQCRDGLVIVTSYNVAFNKATHCPTNFGSGNSGSRIINQNQASDLYAKRTALQQRLDGGRTQALLALVNNVQYTDAVIADSLDRYYPMISDDVLMAWTTRQNLQDAVERTPATNRLRSLQTATNSDGVGRNQLALRQSVIDSLVQVNYEFELLINHIISNYINDTTVTALSDSLYTLLQTYNINYAALHDWAALVAQEPITDSLQGIFSGVGEMNTILEHLYLSGNPQATLEADTALQQQLQQWAADTVNLAGSDLRVAESAQALLRYYLGIPGYTEIVGNAASSTTNLRTETAKPVVENPASGYYRIFPVPASDVLQFVWIGDVNGDALVDVELYDLTGRLVIQSHCVSRCLQFELNVSSLPTGVYTYRLLRRSEQVEQGRVLIQHQE